MRVKARRMACPKPLSPLGTAPVAPFAGLPDCVADVMLVVDRSGSIGITDWGKVAQFMEHRVDGVTFTGASGNRMGVVAFSTTSQVVCPLTHNKAELLTCINAIVYTEGGTNTADAITLAGQHLGQYSDPSRTRVMEGVQPAPHPIHDKQAIRLTACDF